MRHCGRWKPMNFVTKPSRTKYSPLRIMSRKRWTHTHIQTNGTQSCMDVNSERSVKYWWMEWIIILRKPPKYGTIEEMSLLCFTKCTLIHLTNYRIMNTLRWVIVTISLSCIHPKLAPSPILWRVQIVHKHGTHAMYAHRTSIATYT